MKLNFLWSLLAFAAAASKGYGATDSNDTPPVIPTTSGRITGKVDSALPNVHQYLGIPYAVPPVKERRWAAPELLNQPDAEIQATRLPPSCLQYLDTHLPNPFFENVLEFNLQGLNTTGAISEDCLTLSVWAPASKIVSPEGVPVLIFIYGGGFGVGGQDVPYQIPAQWVDRAPDHIVVSFNYRLGIFAFPNADGVPDQNLALLDTRAVVEWCQENIAAFGGDPGHMVLWGQSAGSMMADYYGFAYPDDPIVTGLILNSGTAFTPFFTINDTSRSNFTFVADHVGCAGLADDPGLLLSCMRDVDGDVINEFIANYSETDGSPGLAFVPVEDDAAIFSNYTQRAVDGLQAKIVRALHLSSPLVHPAVLLTTADTREARHRGHQRSRWPHIRRLQSRRPQRPKRNGRPGMGPGPLLLPCDQHGPFPAADGAHIVPLRVLRQLHKRIPGAVDGGLSWCRTAHPDGHAPELSWGQHPRGVCDQPGVPGCVCGFCE